MGISKQARAALERYNSLIRDGLSTKEAISTLDYEGFRSRNNKKYNRALLASISYYSGVKLQTLTSLQTVKISNQTLKEAMFSVITRDLKSTAIDIGVNRETLRCRLIGKYPSIYKRVNCIYLRARFLKMEQPGEFEEGGFIFDLKFKPLIDQYNIIDNGNGYAKIGQHYYHRVITRCPKGMEVDHINRDKKDNRLCNLRVCSKKQNSTNKDIKGYVEITDRKLKKRFTPTVGKRCYVETKEEAIAISLQRKKELLEKAFGVIN